MILSKGGFFALTSFYLHLSLTTSSPRADIINMLNRGQRRYTVSVVVNYVIDVLRKHLDQSRRDQISQPTASRWVPLPNLISFASADGTVRLLQTPFDFSQAFDQALKNFIVALPNRPTKESSDEVV